jgi:phosphoglycolate phosphatase-like HAD superfamily hydrolase
MLINNFMSIKAIFFDYDGVIVDSFRDIFDIYRKICQHLNIKPPANINEFREIYGYNHKECWKNLGIKQKDTEKVQELFKRELVQESYELFPGIKKIILNLNTRYDLFLISGSYKQNVIKNLKPHGLVECFKKIYSSSDRKSKKSILMQEIMEDNDFSAAEIILIGDREIDYDIAKKIGFRDKNIILVDYGWGLNKEKIKIRNIIDKPRDILKIISEYKK